MYHKISIHTLISTRLTLCFFFSSRNISAISVRTLGRHGYASSFKLSSVLITSNFVILYFTSCLSKLLLLIFEGLPSMNLQFRLLVSQKIFIHCWDVTIHFRKIAAGKINERWNPTFDEWRFFFNVKSRRINIFEDPLFWVYVVI